MIKPLVKFYINKIRPSISNYFNNKYIKEMKSKGVWEEYDKIYKKYLEEGVSWADLYTDFYKYYTDYKYDPLFGLIDWSPIPQVAMYRKKDDCDGMAAVGSMLFNAYIKQNGQNMQNPTVKEYVFWYKGLYPKFHVMSVFHMTDCNGNDYGLLANYHIYGVYTLDKVIEHYAKMINKPFNKIDYVELPTYIKSF